MHPLDMDLEMGPNEQEPDAKECRKCSQPLPDNKGLDKELISSTDTGSNDVRQPLVTRDNPLVVEQPKRMNSDESRTYMNQVQS